MEFDFRHILRSLTRFWWIVVIGVLAMSSLGFVVSERQTPLYAARTTVQIEPVQSTNLVDYNALMYAERLTQTFQRMITFRPVLEPVIQQLQLPYTAGELAANVTAIAESDSQLLIIQVSDPDPARAAQISNAIATSFQNRVAAQGLTPANDQTFVPSARILIVEPAVPPASPYAPRVSFNVALGGVVGLILGLGLVLVIAYLDNTVKSTTDFSRIGAGALLASIRKLPNLQPGHAQLYVAEQPALDASEAIRLLRTNLEFASASREISALTISSINASEGKSTVASNLASSLALAGFVTAIVDADLRRPQQHNIFRLDNQRGLSTLLMKRDTSWHSVAQKTEFENLIVIPSGPLPPNAADLLSATALHDTLKELRGVFDIVIVDTPPIGPVSDALVVSGHTDGIVIVCRSGKTRVDALSRTVDELVRGAVRVIGVVSNLEPRRASRGSYYRDAESTHVPGGQRRLRGMVGRVRQQSGPRPVHIPEAIPASISPASGDRRRIG